MKLYSHMMRTDFRYLLYGLIISLFMMPAITHAGYRSTVEVEPTLLHYWPMDESAGVTTLSPAVGGVPITITNATAGVGGQTDGTAVSFNGTSSFGVTNSNINLTAYNKVVVEAMLYVNSYDSTNRITWELSPSTVLAGNPGSFYFAQDTTAPAGHSPVLRGNVGLSVAKHTTSAPGVWRHVVAVYNMGLATNEVDLYIDGVLQTPTSRTTNSNNTANFGNYPFYVMSRGGTSLFSAGQMQHLAIYSDLSPAQILAHAKSYIVPGALTETFRTANSVSVLWTPSTNGTNPVTEQLQRSPAGANTWTNVTGVTASPGIDTTVSPNTAYDYRVAYSDVNSLISYSNIITVTTSKTPPTYQANSNKVIVGPYDTAISGAGNWGPSGAGSVQWVVKGQQYRIRQSGTIDRVRLYTATKTQMTAFYVQVWRKIGTRYALVGQSNNIVSQLVDGGFSTIDLGTPIAGVQDGDYYGGRMESTGIGARFFAYNPGSVSTYYISNDTALTAEMDWEAKTLSSTVVPIELYMQAPQAVFIGDSIISGSPGNLSFLYTAQTSNIPYSMERQLSYLTGYTYQNMGNGGNTTAQVNARFTADALNLAPRILVMDGGVNDINNGNVTKPQFLANWTNMLNLAQADPNITTILVFKIMPWTNGTTVQNQTRDDWNISLEALASGYSKVIVVDTSSVLGQFRAGGDAGNLWDIKPIYDADGVHFTQAGYNALAQILFDHLPKPTATFDNDFAPTSSGTVLVNYNLLQTGDSLYTNISQTATSGIEYSTDGVVWNDATQGVGGDGLTSLTSTTAGTNHVFAWDSSADLPNTNDASVFLRIRPNNSIADASGWVVSNSFAVNNVTATVPGAPTSVTATAGNTEATVSFTPPVSDGGSAITGYTVTSSPGNITGSGVTSPITVTGLTNGTPYTFTVTATNGIGTSSASSASNSVTPTTGATVPGIPTALTPTRGNQQVSLSWTAPVSNGGSAITDYLVEYKLSTEPTTWTTFTDGVSTTTSTIVTGLTNGSSYHFRVSAINAIGTSGSTPIAVMTPATIAQHPTSVAATAGDTQATITFTPPVNNGGDVITSYTVTSSPGNLTASGSASPLTVTGLTNGVSYTFTVTATNGVGTSSASSASNSVTPTAPPTPQQPSQPSTSSSGFYSTRPLFTTTTTTTPATPNPATAYFFTRSLRKGMTGGDVKELQKYLNSQGFTVSLTGPGSVGNETTIFGNATHAAVIKFQKAKNITPPVGFFGPITRVVVNGE